MTRSELLEKLHNIHVGVSLVALTEESVLECTCVTPRGQSYEWMPLYEWMWPAYIISLPSKEHLQRIQKALSEKRLSLEDIKGTEIERLYLETVPDEQQSGDALNCFLAELTLLKESEKVYVLVENALAKFFSNYETFERAFAMQWNVAPWESFSDELLEETLIRIENDYGKIPLRSFCDE